MDEKEFDKIRVYKDEDTLKYMKKHINSEAFKQAFEFIYPNKNEEDYRNFVNNEVNSSDEFKKKCVFKATKRIIDTKSDGLTYNNLSHIDKDETYIYISNHRDIALDAALMSTILLKEGKKMAQSAVGDNLLLNEVIEDIGRMMGCFIVKRNLSPRETVKASDTLSRYIQYLLKDEKRSVWIAQKEGRTKDGNDKTNPAILKMISMANKDLTLEDFLKNIKIIPVAISYELDPTDYLKVPELLALEKEGIYEKQEGEDANSIFRGGLGYKGKIHFEFGKPLNKELDILKEHNSQNKKIRVLSNIIDTFIYKNYKLNEINYVAYDAMHQTERFRDKYTEKDISFFNNRIEVRAKDLGIDINIMKKFMLKNLWQPCA